jgi:WD40 repeat protein
MKTNEKEIIEMEVIMKDVVAAKEKVKETIRYWQSVLDERDRRAMEYNSVLLLMKTKEEEDKKRRDNVESILKLNLRETVFNTTKDTLLKFDNTYFTILLSSTLLELDINGEFFIDRDSIGFFRILDYMSTGVLSTEGLNRYDEDCLYGNLKYFMIPHKSRLWDYSKVSTIENLVLAVFLQLNDGRLCGYKCDTGIYIYNMDTNIIETSLGHTAYVSALIQLEKSRLCSCSFENTIKVWNIKSGQCELTLNGHTSFVLCVIQLTDGRLCSGSVDSTIRIWNKDNGVCELIINSTGSDVDCLVQLRNGSICSGNNFTLNVWNVATGVCEMTLSGHTGCVWAIVVIDELRICSCCNNNTTIKAWNISSGVCERTLEGHTAMVMDLILLLDGRLCSVSADGKMKIWNMQTGECELSIQVCSFYNLHNVVQLYDGRLLLSVRNYSVYIIGE